MAAANPNPNPSIPDAGQNDPNNAVYDPWDTRYSEYDRARHDWIVKNTFGNKNPFVKDKVGGWTVDPKSRAEVLNRYAKGLTGYDAYLKAQQDRLDNPSGVVTDPNNPNAGRGPNDPYYGGGTPPPIFGSNPNNRPPPPPPKDPEARMQQRWGSAAESQYMGDPVRGGAQPAERSGMRVHPNTQWSESQTAKAINKWNEFQQRRSLALSKPSGLPPVNNQQGRPVASRVNTLGNQLPTVNQQQWGSQGGNLNAALMKSNTPWQGPKG